MKKAVKYIIFALLAALFIGTFVYLFKNSRPEKIEYQEHPATVGNVSSSGITLIIPPATTASEKRYKRLITGGDIASGNMVLCAKIDGTYVILGKIANS